MAIPRGLVLALDLLRTPVLAEVMRHQPLLPSTELLVLIRIAGGCPETSREAVDCTGKSLQHIRDAVVLYLKQILLFPDADSYRVLGVDPQASHSTIREHLHWMMRWLHPDRNRNSWETVFACRVLSAWEDLKSSQRREAYDQLRRHRTNSVMPTGTQMRGQGTSRRRGIPWVATPLPRRRSGRIWVRALASALAIVLGLAVWLSFDHRLPLALFSNEAEADSDAMSAPAPREKTRPASEEVQPNQPEN